MKDSKRQKEYQARHRAAGLCIFCSEPATSPRKDHCLKCYARVRARESSRTWRGQLLARLQRQ